MHEVVGVQVLDGREGLGEEDGGLGLGEQALRVLVVEQVAVFHVFHHHVDFVLLLEDIPQLHDVRVLEDVVDGGFPLEGLPADLGVDLIQVDLS